MPDKRTHGLLGLLPGQIPVGLRELPYYAAGPLPQAPSTLAVPDLDYGMLGNDQKGDCAFAGFAHVCMADASVTAETIPSFDTPGVLGYYDTYEGGQDNGAVLSQLLDYIRKNGFLGQTLDSYAPISVQDIPTLHTAIWLYGAAYSGIQVTSAMQQGFEEHLPWTTDMLQSPVVGGHCVPIVGYDDQYVYVITWGGVQAVTYSMWHYIATEAWALITGQFVAKGGDGHINLDALRADLPELSLAA